MLKSYLKIAFRNIGKHKGFSFINIAGLAIGMACCILILLWIQDELSYDKFHENRNELYRVFTKVQYSDGRTNLFTESYFPLSRVLTEECPEVVAASRYATHYGLLVKYGEKSFAEDSFGFADASFLSMFSFPFLKGDPKTALSDKFSVVITEEMSQKYFGREDPMGKTLNVNDQVDLQVTGVIEEVPLDSSLQFDFLIPYPLYWGPDWTEPDHWGGNPLETYVLLNKNAVTYETEKKITSIKEKHDPSPATQSTTLNLQPLTRIHLYGLEGGGPVTYIYIFLAVALFVLIIACINFMNLSTAKAATRAGEVGMRKVVGARKADLIKQFFGESILLSFIALFLALLIVELLLPVFNNLSGKQLALGFSSNIIIILGLLGIAVFTGVVSGSYPALFLSSLQPVKVLKGSVPLSSGSSLFRKVLVVSQFALSIFLIIGTAIIYRQLNYMKNRDMGYDANQLIFIYVQRDLTAKYESVKNELLKNSNILSVTRSLQVPSNIGSTVSALDWEGKNPDESVSMNWDIVDFDYFETLKMEMVQGRGFSREFGSDVSGAYIVNEEAAELMGMESPVGKRLSVFRNEGKVIGVVKNFHFKSLHNEITPFVFWMNPGWASMMSCLFVRVAPSNISETLEYVKSVGTKFSPAYPLRYQFMAERLDRLYNRERLMGKIISYFALLAIVISCLGLFGLASFMTERRTKEIGIRKVLGSSVSKVVFLLSKEFTKWVLVANVIAWPVAYYLMSRWLQNFAYRASLGFWIFIMSGVLILVIALLTVSYQAIRAATANPVDALRYE
ncbi:MAG: FtsX-like permease family protein [Candidatus Aminicenantes bacterium]|nr:FtsX-like permease family protein [Candidatus Aminicenantes bacterium]